MRSSALLFIALCASLSSAQDALQTTRREYFEPQFEPVERVVDMVHLRLEVSFEPAKGLVRGRVTHVFRPLRERVDSLVLNGPGIRVHSVRHRGKAIPSSSSGEFITIHFPDPLRWDQTDSIEIDYEAQPKRGIYFVGWNDPTGRNRRQIWTQGQGTNNRHWIPCFDHQNDKLTTETIITFDRRYNVLSNGTLISRVEHGDGTATWHYRMSKRHTTYLIMIGIGDYSVEERTSSSGVPIALWYYPDQPERVEPTYRYTAEIIDFLERHIGVPYPWESYAQIPVRDFLHGGMENTTATVFTENYFVDARLALDKPYTGVNAHEAAHQWFGDFVTARSGRMAWLHESFATFYTKLFFREKFGEDEYQWQRRLEQEAALEASRQNHFPILHSQAGGARAYQKGSAVLDMLMHTVGEEAYRRVIRYYLAQHAYGSVESNDLYQAFQDVLGLSPLWFFDQWIYRGGEPQYDVSYAAAGGRLPGIEVTVRQTQARNELVGLFRMPIWIELHFIDGTVTRRRVLVERETETFFFPHESKQQIAFVLFDPGSTVLKTLTFERSAHELRAQAEQAPLMIDRYDALVALRPFSLDEKRDLLHRLYRGEKFYAIRSEAVAQLLSDTDAGSIALLRTIDRDPNAMVRLTFVDSLRTIPEPLRETVEHLLGDSSAAVAAVALRKLAAVDPEHRTRYLEPSAGNNGVGDQLRILRLELAFTAGERAALDSLVDLAGQSYDYSTRVEAFGALQRLNILTDKAAVNLLEAMTYWNGRLSGPAATVARAMGAQTAHRERFLEAYRRAEWTARDRSTLEAFLSALGAFPLSPAEESP